MKRKFVQVMLTEKQVKALHESAQTAHLSISDLVRSVLIKHGVIPDDEIQHGGYRERKPKANKQ